MKHETFMAVLVADQVSSRRSSDLVPEALHRLEDIPTVLPFERTVGDELQGLLSEPAAVVDAVVALTRFPGWRIGIGLGSVRHPLPQSTREAGGSAYLSAREAIISARRAPTELALRSAADVRADPYRGREAQLAEHALILLRALLSRRTKEGWELLDLIDHGASGRQAAVALGISPSAVSQRLARAGRAEGERGRELAVALLEGALGVTA